MRRLRLGLVCTSFRELSSRDEMSRGKAESDGEFVTSVRRGSEDATSDATAFQLTVSTGPNQWDTFMLMASQPGRLLVGTGPAAEARLTDPEVSRRHAALEVQGSRLRLQDLGSTNGTFVNGIEVRDALLVGGECVQLGNTAILVKRQEGHKPESLHSEDHFGAMLGRSSAMRRIYPLCERLAQTRMPLIIEGETGTGKEQLARAFHAGGPRSNGPFVVFDCTAVAPNLVESELFGHERGAFTGAQTRRLGVFERARGGSLLIDEIGDLPLELQPKLLRAVERSEIVRVGGDGPVAVDARLMAATRRDLDKAVQLGHFRDDLFHRLAVARVELPPLRERHGDVEFLARHFWQALGGAIEALPHDVVQRWAQYAWPGNVRELKNAVMRRFALGDLSDVDGLETSPSVGSHPATGDTVMRILSEELPFPEARARVMDEFDRRFVEHMLERHDGNVTRAAAAAGISRRYFHRVKARALGEGEDEDEGDGS